MQSSEEWRPVVGWEGLYEVSDHGRVRRDPARVVTRGRWASVLSMSTSRAGYHEVGLYRDGEHRNARVHRLVAEAFLGEPTGPMVRHLDGNPGNNVPSNLAYGTAAENSADSIRHGAIRRLSHCQRGHEMTGDNLYVRSSGDRQCRTCRAQTRARYRAQVRANRGVVDE